MNPLFFRLISQALQLNETQVKNTVDLLENGATIPFISRYRKEATGSLDEVYISQIKEQYEKLKETEKRKNFILASVEEQGKLTEELKQRILASWDIT